MRQDILICSDIDIDTPKVYEKGAGRGGGAWGWGVGVGAKEEFGGVSLTHQSRDIDLSSS